MRSIDEFFAWAAGRPDFIHGDPVPPETLSAAEARVGPFPSDYRALLEACGWFEVGHAPHYGVGPWVPPELDLVSVTEAARASKPNPLPPFFLPFCDNGGGDYFCFDTRIVKATGTSPVFYWDHAICPAPTDDIYEPDFLAYLTHFAGLVDEADADDPAREDAQETER